MATPVGAHAEEAGLPERDQARVATEEVQGHRRDRVDEHVQDQGGREAVALQQQHERDADGDGGHRAAEPARSEQGRQREPGPAAGR
jgi:hypothetical protein